MPPEWLLLQSPQCPEIGKCGPVVWQRARYGLICYLAFIPANPNTPAQRAVRGNFGSVSKRWRTLTQPQRNAWIAAARIMLTRPRAGQCGPLTGFNYFIKVNVPLANRGETQKDLPPPYPGYPKLDVASLFYIGPSDQTPVGSTLFLQANQLMGARTSAPRKFAALAPPPA